jgi:hypothetical protein
VVSVNSPEKEVVMLSMHVGLIAPMVVVVMISSAALGLRIAWAIPAICSAVCPTPLSEQDKRKQPEDDAEDLKSQDGPASI